MGGVDGWVAGRGARREALTCWQGGGGAAHGSASTGAGSPERRRLMRTPRGGAGGAGSPLKKRPYRDKMAGGSETLYFSGLALSYRPPIGLAAARMEARALSVAWMPALEMEMVCCSMASWIATWGA